MKRLLLVITLLACTAGASYAQSAPHIAVVNMARLLSEYHKAKKDLEDFQMSVRNANREIEIMRKELEELLDPVPQLRQQVEIAQVILEGGENTTPRSNEAVISAGEEALQQLQVINQDFESRRERLVSYQETTNENLSERRNSIVTRHMIYIRGVVSDYAETNNYDMVLNTTQGLVYFKESMDLTQPVLEILNVDAPATATEESAN